MTEQQQAEQQTLHAIDTCCCVRCEDWRREHDPTPIDEAFAMRIMAPTVTVSYGTDYFGITYTLVENTTLEHTVNSGWSLKVGGIEIANPTIGQFYTACRLHGIKIKEGKGEQLWDLLVGMSVCVQTAC